MNIAKYFSKFPSFGLRQNCRRFLKERHFFQSSNFRPIFKKSSLSPGRRNVDLKFFHDRDPALQIVRNRFVTSVLPHVWNDRMGIARPSRCPSSSGFQFSSPRTSTSQQRQNRFTFEAK